MQARATELPPSLRRLWELRYWVPLSPLGMAVVVTAVWARYRYGSEELDVVLNAAAMITLLLATGAMVLVLAAAATLKAHLRGSHGITDLELESGVRAATGFFFPRFMAWPMIQVRLQWAEPADVAVTIERAGARFQEVVTPLRRGAYGQVTRRFVIADIFGLARFGIHRIDRLRVNIAPGRAHATGSTLLSFAGGEGLSHPSGPASGEMLDMRRYAYGDPLRHLLWKAFARSRQLLVRTPERAIRSTQSAMAYFVAGRGDEATAGVARLFVENRLLGDEFVFSADGSDKPASDIGKALYQIVKSVRSMARGGTGLAQFLERQRVRGGRHLVLFVPPTTGPWLARVEQIAPLVAGATVVIAVDDDLRGDQRSLLRRVLFAPAHRPSRVRRTLPQVARRMAACGCRVQVVHRPTGELVPVSFLEALA